VATVAQRLQADRLKFPGMVPDEILVLKAWLVLHEREYDSFDYNVRIGTGTDPGPSFPDSTRQMAIQITQLRLDAVAYKGGVPTILEVKRRAGPANVGQLLTYEAIWTQEKRSASPPKLLIVCNTFTPNILPIVKKAGIGLDQVDVDFSLLRRTTAARRGGVEAPRTSE
jgi:hypothetical protein